MLGRGLLPFYLPCRRRLATLGHALNSNTPLKGLRSLFLVVCVAFMLMAFSIQHRTGEITLLGMVQVDDLYNNTTTPLPPETATVHQETLLYNEAQQPVAWEHLVCRKPRFNLFAYSAHYDDREYHAGVGPPVVRLMTVAQRSEDVGVTLLCVLQYANRTEPEIALAERSNLSVGIYAYRAYYQEFLYTCPIETADDIPTNVSLVCSPYTTPTFYLPVEIPEKPPVKGNFAVCVCATYDHRDPYQLIEWMELQKMWGAEKVTVYNQTMDDETARTLLHFAREGFVEFRQSPPFFKMRGKMGAKLHQTPTINDCIYRNMHKYHKILVLDFDEMIVPLLQRNFSELIEAIDRKHHYQHGAKTYVFRNVYFFRELPEDETESGKLVTLRHRTRLEPSERGYSVKSIMDPQACVTMHNHFCWKQTIHYETPGHMVYVHKSLGLNHHYKSCHFSLSTCRTMMEEPVRDDTMLRFKDDLLKAVAPHYEALGLPGL